MSDLIRCPTCWGQKMIAKMGNMGHTVCPACNGIGWSDNKSYEMKEAVDLGAPVVTVKKRPYVRKSPTNNMKKK